MSLDHVEVIDDPDLIRRAMSAYIRRREIDQPNNSPDHVKIDGREYIRLYNIRGTLAVYHLRDDGKLEGIESYPEELDEM